MSGEKGVAVTGAGGRAAGGGGYLAPGAVLDERYEIRREIGRGGMSVVYDALDRQLELEVAVKLLVPPPAAAEVARERMRREVQAVRALRHPGIVRVYDVLDDGHWTFIIMDRVHGGDLQSRVAQHGPLSVEAVARLGAEIAGALDFAHRRGVLHRDVKPHNLLLEPDGRALLTDFGSARVEGQATLTHTGGTVGTLSYMAPEVLDGQRADARADVFSLGMTLYYALCGELPDGASSRLPAAPAIDGHHPGERSPEVPAWLDEAVARATSAEPSFRFQTAASFAELLGAPSHAEGAGVTHAAPRPERCLVCAQPEPLGLVVCPHCMKGAEGSPADTQIVPTPTERRQEIRRRIDALRALAPLAPAADLREAALGRRPLVCLPSHYAADVLRELAERGVEARALTAGRSWAIVPLPLKVLTGAVLASGWLAPSAAGVWLGPTGTLIAGAMAVAALRMAGKPLLDPSRRRSGLPEKLEASVVQAMTALSPGPVRNLLADLVHIGRDSLADGSDADPVLRGQVATLVSAGCEAARELAWLDDTLARLDRQRAGGNVPAAWLDALGRCEGARDGLVQRLLESMAALGMARGHASGAADALADQLAELTRELESELAIQAEAAKEVAALVGDL